MINEYVVDGVPTLIAPGPGPLKAGLMFRVGEADETLATHGITHLLEHLVLYGQPASDYHVNGVTGTTATQFVVQGDAIKITEYFDTVCAALANLPYGRLDAEKDILRVEAQWRGSAVSDIPMWRFGAQGYGLPSMPEYGLRRITADHVEAWRRRWFTRDNAVLWIAGCDEPPVGLRLALPAGTRMPPPTETSRLPTTPAYFNGSSGVAVADMQVEREVAAAVYAELLQRELYRKLRRDGATSYTAYAVVTPRGRDALMVRALVDGLSDAMSASLTGLVEVVQALVAGAVAEADVAAVVKKLTGDLQQPQADVARLPSEAFNVLAGVTLSAAGDVAGRIQSVGVPEVVRIASRAAGSALYMIPKPHHLMAYGIEAAPTGSRFAVSGRTYRSKTHREIQLLIGSDGVSMVTPSEPATVMFERCVAVLAYPDGARSLIGDDAIQINIEPSAFGVGAADMRRVDAAVATDAVIPMPERPADAIPAITARVHVWALYRSLRRVAFRWGVKRAAAHGSTRYKLIVGLTSLISLTAAQWGFAQHHPIVGVVAALVCAPSAIMFFRVMLTAPRYLRQTPRRPRS